MKKCCTKVLIESQVFFERFIKSVLTLQEGQKMLEIHRNGKYFTRLLSGIDIIHITFKKTIFNPKAIISNKTKLIFEQQYCNIYRTWSNYRCRVSLYLEDRDKLIGFFNYFCSISLMKIYYYLEHCLF